MPKKKTRLVEAELPDPEEIDEGPSPEESAAESQARQKAEEDQEQLQEDRQRFGGKGYRYRAHKWNKEEADWELCDSFPVDNFEPSQHLRKFGPGKYQLTLIDADKKYVAGGRHTITLAAFIQDATTAAPAASPNSDLIEFMRMQLTQQIELLKIHAARPPEPKAPMGELIEGLAKLKSLSGDKADKNGDMLETLQMIVAVKDAFGGEEKSSGGGLLGDLKDAIGAFKEMKDAGLLPGSAPRRRPVPTQIEPNPPELAAPVPVLQPGAPIMRKPAAQPPYVLALQKYLPMLLSAAQKGEPAETWGAFILERLHAEIVPLLVTQFAPFASEDSVWDKLLDTAQDPAKVEGVFQAVPGLLAYADWTRAVVAEAVKQQLAADAQEEDAAP